MNQVGRNGADGGDLGRKSQFLVGRQQRGRALLNRRFICCKRRNAQARPATMMRLPVRKAIRP